MLTTLRLIRGISKGKVDVNIFNLCLKRVKTFLEAFDHHYITQVLIFVNTLFLLLNLLIKYFQSWREVIIIRVNFSLRHFLVHFN